MKTSIRYNLWATVKVKAGVKAGMLFTLAFKGKKKTPIESQNEQIGRASCRERVYREV